LLVHPLTREVDLAIVGAGPAGLLTAREAARRGLRVLVLEQRPGPGARPCVLDVEEAAFAAVQVAPPTGAEQVFAHQGLEVCGPGGDVAFQLPTNHLLPLHRGEFVTRLAGLAAAAGASFAWGHEALGVRLQAERCTGLFVRRPDGTLAEQPARVVVDASGGAAVLVRRLPGSCGIDFTDRPTDQVLAVTARYQLPAARVHQLLDRLELPPRRMRIQLGVQGSYSTEMTFGDPDRELFYRLRGVKTEQTPPTPREHLQAGEAALGLGPPASWGGDAIRIRRASLQLVTDGLAVVGEAAGMVLPMHGSGVGTALRAGASLGVHLAEVLGRGAAPTRAALWPWAAAYQRERGAIFASYDANRRLVERLDPHRGTARLLQGGLLCGDDMMATFRAAPLRLPLASLGARGGGLLREPRLCLTLTPALARVFLAEGHWRSYPLEPDPARFARWRRIAEFLLP